MRTLRTVLLAPLCRCCLCSAAREEAEDHKEASMPQVVVVVVVPSSLPPRLGSPSRRLAGFQPMEEMELKVEAGTPSPLAAVAVARSGWWLRKSVGLEPWKPMEGERGRRHLRLRQVLFTWSHL